MPASFLMPSPLGFRGVSSCTHVGYLILRIINSTFLCSHSQRAILGQQEFSFSYSYLSQQKSSNICSWTKLTCYLFFLFIGYRHPSPAIVARTVRILHTLLTLVNKHRNCDKFEVNTQSVAYLAGKSSKLTKLVYFFCWLRITKKYPCLALGLCTSSLAKQSIHSSVL